MKTLRIVLAIYSALAGLGWHARAGLNPSGEASNGGMGARVYNSANITIANGTQTTLTFDSERSDTYNLHSTSSNTERLIAPTPGTYTITGHVAFSSNSTGRRLLIISLNGTSNWIAAQNTAAVSGDATDISISTTYNLSAGDYVILRAFQTSGGSLDVIYGGPDSYSPEFSMVRVR